MNAFSGETRFSSLGLAFSLCFVNFGISGGVYGFGDRACGLCACVRHWIFALAYGLPCLDRQSVGVLQGGHALFQGRMQNLVISFKGGNLS